MTVHPSELVGVAEAAEILGVGPSAIGNYRTRRIGFPAPLAILKMGPLWTRDQIETWAAERAAAEATTRAERIAAREAEIERLRAEVARLRAET